MRLRKNSIAYEIDVAENEPEVPLVLYMGFSNVQLLVLERSLYLFLLVLERSLYLSLVFIRKRTMHFENFDWTFFDGYSYFYSPIFIAS